jgi:polyketide synthase PksN
MERFPRGQWVALVDGKIVGALYSQIISSKECFSSGDFITQGNFHSNDGDILQLLGVAVFPEFSNLQIANTLRFIAINVALCTGMKEVVAVTRCGNSYPSIESYKCAALVMDDPILQFHAMAGAKFDKLLLNYRPNDELNFGHSVLISYSLEVKSHKDETTSPSLVEKFQPLSKESLLHLVNKVTGGNHSLSDEFLQTPFMQLGLDSLKIMELHSMLSSLDSFYGVSLSHTVLFDHPTPSHLLKYLNNTTDQQRKVPPSTVESINKSVFDIGVYGIGVRFPNGANTPKRFFEMLCNNETFFKALPPTWKDRCYSQVAGFLDDESANTFDPAYFGLSHEEASWMDPHQRILLEVVHEALHDAGYLDNLSDRHHKIGVFVGLCNNEWVTSFGNGDVNSPYIGTGTAQSAAANRISFHLGLTGPSVVVDTACSSSLSAVHIALSSLQIGDCDIAVVASADLLLSPHSLQVLLVLLSVFNF